MRDAFTKIYDWYGRALWGFAMLAGVLTFVIMWVIDINAVSRKLINAPVPASLEITQSLLVGAIMLPFAYTLARHEHVNTVFFTSQLPHRMQRMLHFFWMALGFLLFAAVTYGTFEYALRSYRMNEQIWGATIQFAVWPSKMAVSLGTALISVQFLLSAIRALLIDDPRDFDSDPTKSHTAEGDSDV